MCKSKKISDNYWVAVVAVVAFPALVVAVGLSAHLRGRRELYTLCLHDC